MVRGVVQRNQVSEVNYADTGEDIYSDTPATNPAVPQGSAGVRHFTMGSNTINYAMERTDTEVIVTVRIRFVSQTRDTNQFLADGVTANPNFMGYIGSPAEIPAGDPRRGWAEGMARTVGQRFSGATGGRVRFVGQRDPAWHDFGGRPQRVSLNVRFRAEPVFDLGRTDFHKEVKVFASNVIPGRAAGHPIDAGAWYMDTTGYAPAEQVYAHEYGHLIGIPDEYSLSNDQMHRLMHRVSPSQATTRNAAIDRAAVRRMVLAALTRPLVLRLASAAGELARTFTAHKAPLVNAMTTGMRGGAADAGTNAALVTRLQGQTAPPLQGRLPGIVRFETTQNFSNRTIAQNVVAGEFAPAALADLLNTRYLTALTAPHSQMADVGMGAGRGVSIAVQGSAGGAGSGIWAAANSGALAGSAGGVADTAVGAAGGARVPPVRPPATLIAQIGALPGRWQGMAAQLRSAFSEAAVGARMRAAAAAMPAAAAAAAGAIAGPATTAPQVYRRAYDLVGRIARTAGQGLVRDFLQAELEPLLQSSTATIAANITTEVENVMNTPAGALASAAPRDPNLTAMVTAMQSRLAAQTPAGQPANADPSAAPRQPVPPGSPAGTAAAPVATQEVTFTAEGQMGDNAADLRTDQFQRLVDQFNQPARRLRRDREGPFTVEM